MTAAEVHRDLAARAPHFHPPDRLVLEPRDQAARHRRTLQQLLNDPPLLAFGPIPRHVGGSPPGGSSARGASSDAGGGGIVGLRRKFSLSEGHIMHNNVHLLVSDMGRGQGP